MNDHQEFLMRMEQSLNSTYDCLDGHTDSNTMVHIAFQIGVMTQLVDEEKRRANAIMEATNKDSKRS